MVQRFFFLLLLAIPVQILAEPSPQPTAAEWVVVLTDPRPPRQRGWATGAGYAGGSRYDAHPALARLADDIASEYSLTVAAQWPVRSLGVHCLRVSFDNAGTATRDALESDPRVRWVQPLNEFEGSSADASARHYRELQTSLEIMNLGTLHARLRGRGVSVAVIDSAVERDHPDLRRAVGEYRDFVASRASAGGERHGTGVAAVIAAADNGVGITGVSPAAEIYAYRACWEAGSGKTVCDSLSLSRALDRAVSQTPQVVNLSLTGPADRLLESLLERLMDQGALVVAAFDEKRREDQRCPAPAPAVLYVRDSGVGQASSGSTLAAPGQRVLTAQPGHGWDFMEGHSLAAAHVSGVLALMLEARPGMSHETARASLQASMGEANPNGSIDACRAVAGVAPDLRCETRRLAYQSW